MKLSIFNNISEYKEQILIYNSLTKGSIFLEKDSDLAVFKDINNFKSLNAEDQNTLLDNGFVVNDDKDELLEFKYIFEKNFFRTDFLNISLIPSLRCNFNCPYCCEKGYVIKEDINKYFNTLKKYAEKVFKSKNLIHLSMFGGEPLLHINEFIDFFNWVNSNNYKYITSIVTNGSLITEEVITDLLKHNLKALQITLDSDIEMHNNLRAFKDGKPSYELLMKNIDLLLSLTKDYADFKFTLRINLNNTNTSKVSKALSNIRIEYRNRVDLLIRAVYNTDSYNKQNLNSVANLEEYFEIGKELGFNIKQEIFNYQSCEGCSDSKFFYLLPDLSMWKCINDLHTKHAHIGKINSYGNVETLPEKIIKWYNHALSCFSDKKCINCKQLPNCMGGCIMYKLKNGKKSCRSFDMTSKAFIY